LSGHLRLAGFLGDGRCCLPASYRSRGALGVEPVPISADDLHPEMLPEPLSDNGLLGLS
jgi:hypothetical protein